MAIRVKVDGTIRTSDARLDGIVITRRIEAVGNAQITMQSLAGAWRPSLCEILELWEPDRRVLDGAIGAGDTTFTSATANFTSADIGKHVRIAGAMGGVKPLYTEIVSITSSTSVEVELAAAATVSGQTCLIGICRFTGPITALAERRVAGRASTREWAIGAQDLAGAVTTLCPATTRPSERMYTRANALITACGAAGRGVRFYWPLTADTLADETGADLLDEAGTVLGEESYTDLSDTFLAATTYDGTASLADVLTACAAEDGGGLVWSVDTLGRLRFQVPSTYAAPTALTTATIRLGPQVSHDRADYANRQRFLYTGGTVTVDDATEQAAVGIWEAPVITDLAVTDALVATARAQAALDARASRSHYVMDLATSVDGFAPGQIASVTMAEHGVSGDHLVQSVTSRYLGLSTTPWTHQLAVTNATTPAEEWIDYYLRLLAATQAA